MNVNVQLKIPKAWINSSAHRGWQCLHHAFDEAGVQMNYEHSQEGHLLACVLKDDPRIVRLASKAVGGHHHSQVVYIHLGHSHVRWLREYLEVMKRWSHLAAVQVCNFKKKG